MTSVALATAAAALPLFAFAEGRADLDRPALAMEAGVAGALPEVRVPTAVLYSQLDNAAGNGAPDQDFEAAFNAYDCNAADDFIVPAGQLWRITRINTVGTQSTGGTSPSVDVIIHADAAGKPGAAVCTYNALVPTSQAGGSYVLDLPTPCVATSCGGGHFWIDIQSNQDFGSAGQHFWSNRTTQSNTASQWRNPLDGFATGCTDWTNQQTCGVGGGVGADFLFSVEGTAAVAKGDMNSDGCTDLVFRSNINGAQNKVWFMDGVTRTSEAAVSPDASSASLRIRGVDDFNADSLNDLVFWNQTSGAVEFWLMNGITRVGAPLPLTGGPTLPVNWDLSGTADFNHDGLADIVWRNFTSQKIVIWTMNGAAKIGNIIPTPDQALDGNWLIVAAADYTNDGNTDFLWYNYSSGKIVTWYMNASVVRTTGQFTVPPNAGDANWKVVASADYSASYTPGTPPVASPDVVWRNETSGNQVVWHLDFASTRVHGQFTNPTANTPALDWVIVGPR